MLIMTYLTIPKLIRIKASYLCCSLAPTKWIFEGREEECFVIQQDLRTGKDNSSKVLVHIENLITPRELESIKKQPKLYHGPFSCICDCECYYSIGILTEKDAFVRKVESVMELKKEKGLRSFARVFNRIEEAIDSTPLYS
jgi:hypothetical protein